MAKDKMMEFYRAGMERAYRLYKEEGAEALEKEIRFRNTTHINSPLLAKEIDKSIDEIKWHTIQTVMAMAIGVLYSEFGFGKKTDREIQRCIHRSDKRFGGWHCHMG